MNFLRRKIFNVTNFQLSTHPTRVLDEEALLIDELERLIALERRHPLSRVQSHVGGQQ